MLRNSLLLASAVAALALPAAAQAQSESDTKTFAVIGNVPAMCAGGTLVGGNSTFDLGVLIDTTTGFLRTDLAALSKVLSGAYCSGRSTITVSASAMAAQNFTAAPPAGFSRTVDYTAIAAGWTTAAASNPAATQTRATAFTGDIAVGISGFATGGGNTLRLVADTNYRGLVTVTLAAAN